MTFYRTTLISLFAMLPQLLSADDADWMKEYPRLLQTYVSEQGVDYQSWKNNPQDMQALDDMIRHLERHGPGSEDAMERLAYFSNAYNLFVLDGVLDAYPVDSVKEIAFAFGFFTVKRQTLHGEKMSLNHLEKQILLKEFEEPRVHFIINCASFSCPALPAVPLTADNLEQVMDAATRRFINEHPDGVRVTRGRVEISKIFDWYADDFEKSAGSVRDYINRYRNSQIDSGLKISILKYDWRLNDSSPARK